MRGTRSATARIPGDVRVRNGRDWSPGYVDQGKPARRGDAAAPRHLEADVDIIFLIGRILFGALFLGSAMAT